MSAAPPAALHRRLLRWYDLHRRRLPWRERPSPYRTWISEIMLQQTQVATVLPYYERFLRRFPDIRALAAAPEREVLKYWAGLGYYSRARNLRCSAQTLVREHRGRFPDTWEEVLALPGIGRYTAGAILSIAFQRPYPVLDGNVMRVFARLFGIRAELKKTGTQKRLWNLAERLIHTKRPGDWNQALMELGARICLPESPRCGECPVSRLCAARKLGLQDRLPNISPGRKSIALHWTCLWAERDGRILLWKRSDSERFLPGHWGLPELRHLASSGLRPASKIGETRHAITHHRILLEVRRTADGDGPSRLPAAARWVRRGELKDYLVSSLWMKVLPRITARESSRAGRR